MRICANDECNNVFVASTVSNVFCSPTCRRDHSNRINREKAQQDKLRLEGRLRRVCEKCKYTILSRYNEDTVCAGCIKQVEADANKKLLQDLGLA